MDFLQAFSLGLLQGFTEFLPVSSSGHLFLAQYFWDLTPNLHFEILLHVASLFAVIILFWKKIPILFQPQKDQQQLGLKLLVATFFTFPLAYLIQKNFDALLSLQLVATTLIITGFLILIAEKFRPKTERTFSWKMAVLLGLVQGFAPLPGISRSGITIAYLIFAGLKRQHAAEISFLLAIPTILAALVFSWLEQGSQIILTSQVIFACIIAFFAAIAAMKWMMKLVEKKWIYFAPYCFILGVILFLV